MDGSPSPKNPITPLDQVGLMVETSHPDRIGCWFREFPSEEDIQTVG